MRGRLIVWVLLTVFQRLACDTACRVGGGLGVLAWRCGVRRRTAQTQLTRVLGLRGRVRQRLIKRSFATVGAAFCELWSVGGCDGPERHITVLAPTHARRLTRHGHVAVMAHLASWDLAAGAWVTIGGRVIAYAKQQRDQIIDAATNRQRERLGIEIILARRGDPRQAITVIRAVRAGATVGLLADQRPSGDDGVAAQFLGHACVIAAGPGFFSARAAAPIIPVVAVRRRAGRVVVLYGRPQPLTDPTAAAQVASDLMGATIAAFPGQYFWQHNRLRHEAAVAGAQAWRGGIAWLRRTSPCI